MMRSLPFALFPVALLYAGCSGAPDTDGADDVPPHTIGESDEALRKLPLEPTDPLPVDPPPPPRRVLPPIVGPLPTVLAPIEPVPDADLRPDGSMRFYTGGGATVSVMINVVNVGTSGITSGTAGRVSIDGSSFTGKVYRYWDGSSATALLGGGRGYIQLDSQVAATFLPVCSSHSVAIDLDHTMQAGANVFANDVRQTLAYQTGSICPLKWSSPVNGATLGEEPDPHIAGKSLRDIVSSAEIARVDGNRCSACHNSGSAYPYAPGVAAGGTSTPPSDPFQLVSRGEAWAGSGAPYAPRFLALPDSGSSAAKPAYLKSALRKWLLDGAAR